MLPAYVLSVDITAENSELSKAEFQELILPSLSYLDGLKMAFDKKLCDVTFFPPSNSKGWSARCVVMISVGKKRAEGLVLLYEGVVRLISFELPDCIIEAETSRLEFS